jgi:hypothetical protein
MYVFLAFCDVVLHYIFIQQLTLLKGIAMTAVEAKTKEAIRERRIL